MQPEILLLDEFLAGICHKGGCKLADLLHVLWIFGRYTMLTFTGDDQDAIQTDRKIYLDHGKNHEDEYEKTIYCAIRFTAIRSELAVNRLLARKRIGKRSDVYTFGQF